MIDVLWFIAFVLVMVGGFSLLCYGFTQIGKGMGDDLREILRRTRH